MMDLRRAPAGDRGGRARRPDPVAPELLAQMLEQPVGAVERWCAELAVEYEAQHAASSSSGVAGGYRYQTHPDLTPYVERFVLHDQQARLSGAALETLAIVAYKQPISRAQIASIRGVDPDGVIRTLQGRGYIDDAGHDAGSGPGGAVRHDAGSSSRSSGSTRSTNCRRSPSTSPTPTWSRPSKAGCEHPSPTERPATSPRALPRRAHQPAPPLRRLQKVLAAGIRQPAGVRGADRRRAVTVNGEVAVLGRPSTPSTTRRGGRRSGRRQAGLVHYLLNKPAAWSRRPSDTHGRPTVVELVPAEPRVFPVGPPRRRHRRLLLLTNDGELANRIAHPRHGVEKEYLATSPAAGAAARDAPPPRRRRTRGRHDRAGEVSQP